jgi:hypothetical protein
LLDLLGKRVMLITEGSFSTGEQELTFDVTGLKPGTYICRLTINDNEMKYVKLVVMR